ncbi:RAMP superfamily CRISPR-associated protein [Porphyromonas sp. COT-290 OH860]|uniref:RAMP superfamily CRISPR-associated protein n=1 Tax=Porphyromonas sp. COT-290 OH860 TaxID=1515615 RepID=UPI0005C5F0D4|nr:RAMP superfamily CRISPR-associated protein [Porphyromonas sp. COT-290 OH860]
MKTAAFLIKCLTNLHVGTGGASYQAVDNTVQRDVASGRPCIYASSLKGALRQFMTTQLGENNPMINHVFGTRGGNEPMNGIGHFSFFQANLVAYPLRDGSAQGYTLGAHTKWQAEVYELYQQLSGTASEQLKQRLEADTAISNEQKEKELEEAIESLPIIARNCLDNGESKNLWYEEVTPSASCFVFFVTYPEGDSYFEQFNQALHGKVVQIGANGSVGYGFCKIECLTDKPNANSKGGEEVSHDHQ